MSEKMQGTAASLREKMLQRYSDGDHKHNKCRHEYRQHYRSHPVTSNIETDVDSSSSTSTGLLREFNLRKTRKKRLDKARIH